MEDFQNELDALLAKYNAVLVLDEENGNVDLDVRFDGEKNVLNIFSLEDGDYTEVYEGGDY